MQDACATDVHDTTPLAIFDLEIRRCRSDNFESRGHVNYQHCVPLLICCPVLGSCQHLEGFPHIWLTTHLVNRCVRGKACACESWPHRIELFLGLSGQRISHRGHAHRTLLHPHLGYAARDSRMFFFGLDQRAQGIRISNPTDQYRCQIPQRSHFPSQIIS